MRKDLTPAQNRILNWLLRQHEDGSLKEQFFAMAVFGGGFLIENLIVPENIREDIGDLGLKPLVRFGYLINDDDLYAFTSKCFTLDKKLDSQLSNSLQTRRKFRKLLVDYFSIPELNNLCFDLGIDSENLKSQVKDDFVISLLRHVERNNRMDELIKLCEKDKPNLDWSFDSEIRG